jgi:hypothetical protein
MEQVYILPVMIHVDLCIQSSPKPSGVAVEDPAGVKLPMVLSWHPRAYLLAVATHPEPGQLKICSIFYTLQLQLCTELWSSWEKAVKWYDCSYTIMAFLGEGYEV